MRFYLIYLLVPSNKNSYPYGPEHVQIGVKFGQSIPKETSKGHFLAIDLSDFDETW